MAKKKTVVKGGVLGIILGAIGGVLLAPKSGKETRKDLRDAATKANKEAEVRLKELYAELKTRSDDVKDKADEYSGKAKKEYEELSEQTEAVKQRVSEMISSVRDFEVDDIDVEKTIKEGKKLVASIAKKLETEGVPEPAAKKAPAKKKPAAKKPATKKAPSSKSKK